jgi:protein-tyrosine kinase
MTRRQKPIFSSLEGLEAGSRVEKPIPVEPERVKVVPEFPESKPEPERPVDSISRQSEPLSGIPEPRQPEVSPPLPGNVPPDQPCYTRTRTVPVVLSTLVQNRLIVGSPNTMILQGYKLLRTHLLQKTWDKHQNVLMVTGCLPDEGKTLTSVNLAISMAQEMDKTVLLVDGDLHSPSIHHHFGMSAGKGLVDYLEGRASIPDLLVHPQGLDRLVILPGGRPTEWATELIRSPKMSSLVPELKACYPDRYVLFDLPPLLSFADALAFAPMADGIIVVVRARKTRKADLVRCMDMLEGFPVLGYVLNGFDEMDSARYYRHYPQSGKGWLPWLKLGKG